MAKKVLVIEDSPTEAAIVKDLLVGEGLEADISQNGEEGLKKARQMKPDLIMLDINLPGMNGYDVCKKLREDSRVGDPIIIMLSIRSKMDDINKAFNAGANDYIIKPPMPEFIVKKVKLYLGIK
ncbi:MAG: response regulator [Candidatus Ancaeobacter aquaticus]|nr:response regulator [Candidatus Ancaeobacter aquaticus]